MEELMPELVSLVLGHVDSVSLVACRFACATWMRIISAPQEADQEKKNFSEQCAANGWLAVLQWARANGCPWDESTCAGAAEGGHLEVLQWARAHGCPWDKWTWTYAVKGGHLEMLQWAQANGCPQDL